MSVEFRVETTQNMDLFGKLPPGQGRKRGLTRAHVTVWESADHCSPTLPTLREFIDKNVDPATDVLTFDVSGSVRLSMDPAPLRALPPEYLDYRVSPGASFVTYEALEHAKAGRGVTT